MTEQQHPITPSPELVEKWASESPIQANDENWSYELYIAHHAARWGADEELEACCEWLCAVERWKSVVDNLRAARRPKPPSLRKQSLALIDKIQASQESWDISELNVIRRALEQSND